MGIIDFSLKEGIEDLRSRVLDPFKNIQRQPADLKGAHERNDFRDGLIITEIENGVDLTQNRIVLRGSDMPTIPFTFSGEQKLVKDYYPGNREPTVQVLGAREDDIKINGRLKAKTLGINITDENLESFRSYPQEMQQLIDAMRIRGNLVRLELGEFVRFGFIQSNNFMMKTLADIDYEINFLIIGFTPPQNCNIVNATRQIPFDVNQDLIEQVEQTRTSVQERIPDSFDDSLAAQINSLTNDVAVQINLVTNFINTVLNEVTAIRQSVDRAEGLIKNARLAIRRYITRLGSLDIFGNVALEDPNGISGAYNNAVFFNQTISEANDLSEFLRQLQAQLDDVFVTEPVARHRVVSGDTLQALAVRFYNDHALWENIYEHNNLTDTDLSLIAGNILEIPEVS